MRTLNRKNVVLIVLAIVLLIVCIVGGIYMVRINEDNSETEPTVEEIVSGRLNAYNTDLLDSLNSFTSNEAVANYLVNWGKHKQIKAVKDEYNNVIFTIKAAEGYESDLYFHHPRPSSCELYLRCHCGYVLGAVGGKGRV